MKKLIVLLFALITLTACASLQQMQKNYAASVCSENGAYAAGVNAGKINRPMQTVYNSSCSSAAQSSLNAAYRSGYQFGLSQYSQQRSGTQININTNNSARKTNGKKCYRTAFGGEVCGYNCLKDFRGDIRCAQYPNDNCVKNSFGDVKCGKNCRAGDFASVRCDIER
jgi:uncharacterized protein YcfL